MSHYKISVIRLGYIEVEASTEKEAREQALHACIDSVHWLSEKEGLSGPFLITLVEK